MDESLKLSENRQTIADTYVMTAGETKLIQAMLNPENIGISVVDLCKAAGLSRDTFYTAMKKPEFVKLYQETAMSMIKNETYPLIKVGLREAKRGSFQHWKVLLEMAGLYSEKSTIDVNETFNMNLTVDDRRSRLIDILSRRQLPSIIDVESQPAEDGPEDAD
jgi:hypothetical protein